MNTLAEAKQFINDGREEDVNCPCCGTLAKVYARKFNHGMVASLIYLYGTWKRGDRYVFLRNEIPRKVLKANQYQLPAYWGLMKKRTVDGKPQEGQWRITGKGIRFLHRKLKVPQYALLYKGDCLGFRGNLIGPKDAVGVHFDFRELMNTVISNL